ncbi:ser/threonine protein phosphatase [Vallitalea longa]|uniref:Ser/threonine protein phosphatase n=1 Tax=Vallitalea longa TaxID=2936439 RepID=A0A9W6DEZ4_9FIRM|nr:metallophosphoesterase [Vallitalea longa]GKX28938.1 ser/threonine protein phosphatase [Vallitalea longa]
MIYAIGDLHLGFSNDKPMNVFGKNWDKHYIKIKEDWERRVKDDDLVLVPGDISWAMKLEEAKKDIDFIKRLPGRKILVKGNHDYWWSSLNKVSTMYKELEFIQNNSIIYNDIAICGTRGWICPNKVKFTEDDEKLYYREVNRTKIALDNARKHADKIYVMTHFPPTNDKLEPSEFTKLYDEYNVDKVIYGHLHGKESFKMGLQGIRDDVEYILVSCDYLDFKLKIIDK